MSRLTETQIMKIRNAANLLAIQCDQWGFLNGDYDKRATELCEKVIANDVLNFKNNVSPETRAICEELQI